jgi:hypothetical protein
MNRLRWPIFMTRQQSLRQRNPNPKKNAGAGASTPEDLRTVVFYQRTYARIIRPALSVIPSTSCRQDLPMVRAFHKLQSEIDAYIIQKAA